MKTPEKKRVDFGARSVARQLVMQALYQWQLNNIAIADLLLQFSDDKDYKKSDKEYFVEVLEAVVSQAKTLDEELDGFLDRPIIQLDPVAHAILWVGLHELKERDEIPYRVIINESVKLTKKFGAEDSHKFVNAVLDKLATKIRSSEVKQAKAGRK